MSARNQLSVVALGHRQEAVTGGQSARAGTARAVELGTPDWQGHSRHEAVERSVGRVIGRGWDKPGHKQNKGSRDAATLKRDDWVPWLLTSPARRPARRRIRGVLCRRIDAPGEALAGPDPVVRGEREIGGGSGVACSDGAAVAWVRGGTDVDHQPLVVVVADAKPVAELMDVDVAVIVGQVRELPHKSKDWNRARRENRMKFPDNSAAVHALQVSLINTLYCH